MLRLRDPKTGGAGIVKGLEDLCWYVSQVLRETENPGIDIMYELGSYNGESAEIFTSFFVEIHCVDPWETGTELTGNSEPQMHFDAMMARHPHQVIKHVGFAHDVAPTVKDGSLDFVYVDAGFHDYRQAHEDIEDWWPKIRKGGVIGGHDLQPNFPGVGEAVDWLLDHHDDAYKFRTYADSSFTVRKA